MILGHVDAARRLGAPPSALTPLVDPAPSLSYWLPMPFTGFGISSGILAGTDGLTVLGVLGSVIGCVFATEIMLLFRWREKVREQKREVAKRQQQRAAAIAASGGGPTGAIGRTGPIGPTGSTKPFPLASIGRNVP